jgi:hypothetical protein
MGFRVNVDAAPCAAQVIGIDHSATPNKRLVRIDGSGEGK